MTIVKYRILLAAALPVVALSALIAYHQFTKSVGKEVVFHIQGYDPRDLLSGNYLIYSVKDLTDSNCQKTPEASLASYYCVKTKSFSFSKPSRCAVYLKGQCKKGRFVAGIERFYVPEQHAKELEKYVLGNKSSISVKIDGFGNGVVTDLLLEGEPWKKVINTSLDEK